LEKQPVSQNDSCYNALKLRAGLGFGYSSGLQNKYIAAEKYKLGTSLGLHLYQQLNKSVSRQFEVAYIIKGASWGGDEDRTNIILHYWTASFIYSFVDPFDLTRTGYSLSLEVFVGKNALAKIEWDNNYDSFLTADPPEVPLRNIINEYEYGFIVGLKLAPFSPRWQMSVLWYLPVSDTFKNDKRLGELDFSNKKNAHFNTLQISVEIKLF